MNKKGCTLNLKSMKKTIEKRTMQAYLTVVIQCFFLRFLLAFCFIETFGTVAS